MSLHIVTKGRRDFARVFDLSTTQAVALIQYVEQHKVTLLTIMFDVVGRRGVVNTVFKGADQETSAYKALADLTPEAIEDILRQIAEAEYKKAADAAPVEFPK